MADVSCAGPPLEQTVLGASSIFIPSFLAFSVTECGFGADIGMEKFFNIKCRYSGE